MTTAALQRSDKPGDSLFPAPAESGARRPDSFSALVHQFAGRSVSVHAEIPLT